MLRELYTQANYPQTVEKEMLIRDLFISGVASPEAKRLLFQEDSDNLTIARCVHLVSSYEAVDSNQGAGTSSSLVPDSLVVSATQQRDTVPPSYPPKPRGFRCFGCGQQPTKHARKNCPALGLLVDRAENCGAFRKSLSKNYDQLCGVRRTLG